MASDQSLLAGSVTVDEIILSTIDNKKRLNIKGQVIEFNIYESIFSTFLNATMVLQDGIGLFNNYPIVGEEKVKITFRIPNSNEQRAITAEFHLFSVDTVDNADDNLSSTYVCNLTSLEKRFDVVGGVSNAYRENISSMVQKIVKDNFNTTKSITTEQTAGIQHINFPNGIPSKALSMCANRAVSEKNISSSYVFFERLNDGFFFKTIEQLIKDGKKDIKEYKLITQNVEGTRDDEFFKIVSFNVNKRFNTFEKMVGGCVDSELLRYDLITKKQNRNTYKYRNMFNKVEHIDDRSSGKMLTDGFIKDFEDDSQFPATRTEYSYVVEDSSKPPTLFERSYGYRKMYMTSMSQIDLTISVPGLTNIKAGDVINIRVPSFDGNQELYEDQEQYVTGNFLVANVKHLINTNQNYSVVMDLAKDSYRNEINEEGRF